MSKNKINENMLSRFFGDVFDNLRDGTADRFIKKVRKRKFPKELVNSLEKLKKDRDDFEKKLKAYEKKYGEKPNLK
jgi:uncharacterized protein YaaW (UPF0174 family)